MNENVFAELCDFYGWKDAVVTRLHSGLINHTWKVLTADNEFILQKINTSIFKQPKSIDANLRMIAAYLKVQHPDYVFTAPVAGTNNETLCCIGDAYYRSFSFVKNSHTINVVQNAQEATEAAFQFGKFTAVLNAVDPKKLKITLPDFHNLSLRYHQFEYSIKNGNQERVAEVKNEISFLLAQKTIAAQFEKFINHPDAKQRVTHHDTKISNVLFDNKNKGICVIDLDTIMPGYFFSDVGDMFRTYVCPVSEEEADLSKIVVRKDFMKSIQDGYLKAMDHELTGFEKDHFLLSGVFLMYMQALRFLTDYMNDDIYYGKKYPMHNLVRARNQIQLLQEYQSAIQ
jgi:Ser/Thr protein kinase RdoA (MazF antagonist)